jgi:SAM-dependent methyltransferase
MGKAIRRRLVRMKMAVRRLLIASDRRHERARRWVAGRYLRGDGLEIGALHMPLRLPRGARARYVDRMDVDELRAHYPELEEYNLVTPDIIDDGEELGSVPAGSADFVVANHLLEHCQDPIGTLFADARVLREGGTLYLAVPDRRMTTFDRDREETALEHLVRDHEDGPHWSRAAHYEEWARHAIKVAPEDVPTRAAELDDMDYSIHFHTFTPTSFLSMLLLARRRYGLPLEVLALETNGHEFIMVARKSTDPARAQTVSPLPERAMAPAA